MQQSWRRDADKLTFIVCRPILSVASSSTGGDKTCLSDGDDASEQMIGDTNLFLRFDDDDNDDNDICTDEKGEKSIIAEIELMIAEKQNQGHGYGRAALLSFLWYIVRHEKEILNEFLQSNASETADAKSAETAKGAVILKCLSVKIGKNNTRSLALFESLHFEKISAEPNYFDEFELRRYGLDANTVESYARTYGIKDYREICYNDQ